MIPGEALLSFAAVKDLAIQPDEERWLIDGLWGLSAVGVVGGPPKTFKSWLALEMATAVASGTDALGRFPVRHPGGALVYLAEDSLPQVRARVLALCRGRGRELEGLALQVITEPVLRLDQERDLKRLAATIAALKPRLLVLDPLVRLHRLDENSATEISGLLSGVRELQRRFDVAIALVHHTSKKTRAQPGQALRGSGDLHALGDSNAYLGRQRDRVVLTIEQRAARSPEPLAMELIINEEQRSARLRVRPLDAASGDEGAAADLDDALLDLLDRARAPLTRANLRERLRVNNQRLGDILARMAERGQVARVTGGIVLARWQSELEHCRPKPGETAAGSAGAQPAKG